MGQFTHPATSDNKTPGQPKLEGKKRKERKNKKKVERLKDTQMMTRKESTVVC